MNRQYLASMGGLAVVLAAVALVTPTFVVGQGQSTAAQAPAKAWTLPRTPDGQPELQGYWSNNTYTTMERSAQNANKEFFTREEAEAQASAAAAREAEQTTPGTTGDVHYDFTQFGLDRSQGTRADNLRTSWVIDPPNGRLPERLPEFQTRANARRTPTRQGNYDTVKSIAVGSRCIIGSIGTPIPLFPQGYNSNYQIAQGPGYVMILTENIGDVRIISLDLGTRPAPPKEVTQWTGISRGKWEGDTLIVETTNFNERSEGRHSSIAGASSDFKLIERFKRTGPDTLIYEVTVNDPASYVKPWTAQVPFQKMEGPIFEPACHEGNYGIANTLAGARLAEKTAAENPTAAAPAAGGRGAGGARGAGGQRGGGARGGAPAPGGGN